MEDTKLTTRNGSPVADNQNIMTAGKRGPALLQDVWFLEKMAHFDRELIPERRMQPGNLFRLMTEEKRNLLYKNTKDAVGTAQQFIQIRHIRNCYKADPAYGEGVAKALGLSMQVVFDYEGYGMKKTQR